MAISRVQVNAAEMKRDGKWFHTWIITTSQSTPMVSLGDFSGVHVETLIARAKKFNTLPGDPVGISISGYCKSDVPSNCGVAINIEQDGMVTPTPARPND